MPERQFFADWQRYPSVPSRSLALSSTHADPDAAARPFFRSLERTQAYSPFLLNVILATGCRYLDPDDDFPPEICGLLGDFDTRGDVFVTWSRYLLDQEWCVALTSFVSRLVCEADTDARSLSQVQPDALDHPRPARPRHVPRRSRFRRALLHVRRARPQAHRGCVVAFARSRPAHEPADTAPPLALADFGLNLGPHRLSMSMGVPLSDELVTARRDCFWSAFCSDIVSSLCASLLLLVLLHLPLFSS